ncbi:MAG: type I secretion system permease/ATPase [Alphaproteobacteria bacterium]|nr:type I secretion system permease/ATPase [Alphaproteobacteria bacterium]
MPLPNQPKQQPMTSKSGSVDPLLECLVFLASKFGRTRTSQALVAGLPYDARGMGPELFCEAATRIGLKTKIIERAWEDIDDAVLPCVALLGSHDACVVLARAGDEVRVFVPVKGEGMLPTREFLKAYKGFSIFVHPEAEAVSDPLSGEALRDSKQHWFWGLVRENKALYRRVAVAALLINLFAFAGPIFTMNVYDRVIPNAAMHTGWVLAIGITIVYGFDLAMRTLRGYFVDLAGRKIDVLAARRIYDQVLNMRLAGRPKSSGAFANMLREFESVKEFFTSATLMAFVDLPFAVLFIAFIFFVSPILGLIVLIVTLVSAAISYTIQKPLRYLIQKTSEASEARHGVLVETIHGLETIKAIRADGRFRARYGDFVGESAAVGSASRFFGNLTINVAIFFQQISSVFIIVAGMYLVADGQMTMGALIASVMLAGRATAPIAQIAAMISRYHSSRGALATLERIMKMPVERPQNRNFLHRPTLQGGVTFDRVSFQYPSTGRDVIDQITFKVNAGEKVGIIGRIGSGKSTIARLIMGLYEPTAGSIIIDDTDQRQIDPADLRRNIAYIPQDVVLFSGTIRDNITASFSHASDDEVLEASKAAGVHDFVSKLPQGYDTPVGERGEGLSGGQRQAIALARALITKPRVLLCDEPTNSMDVQAEDLFSKHIEEQAKGRTLVLITHRQNLLKLVDRLILIDQGKIVADGPRDKVIDALAAGQITVRKV